jgi:Na+-translocating ferredoxin:NAD+ oxidoreductase RnfG subunit
MRRLLPLLLAALCLTAIPAPAIAQAPEFYEQVYLSKDQALAVALPPHDKVVARVLTLTDAERKLAQRRLGRKLEEPSYTFYEGQLGGKPVGRAIVLDELGKHYPITFVVGLTPDGAVREVAVMTYREKRGDALKRRRVLNQFKDQTDADPHMINRDIVHLTGATVSSWSIAAGVKKAVVLHDTLLAKRTTP